MTPERFSYEPGKSPQCTLSIVVPVYNEAAVLLPLHRRIEAVLTDLPGAAEVIYVDDGSTDGSFQMLQKLRLHDSAIGLVRFTRNFGKELAMSAGLHLARGAAVVVMDADLQDPPEFIPAMLERWRDGAEVINMRRRRRAGETWLKKATADIFYRVLNRLSEVPIPRDVGDFRLLDRRAVDALNRLPERNRFMKGLFAWIGFRQATLDYDRDARAAGTSKWHYWRLWNFALEGITAFSVAPLKVSAYVGCACAMGSFGYALYFLTKTLVVGDPVHGFPTLIVTILFLGGLQLMAIGVLGEYLARLFTESKRRPLYLIDQYQPSSLRESDVPMVRELTN